MKKALCVITMVLILAALILISVATYQEFGVFGLLVKNRGLMTIILITKHTTAKIGYACAGVATVLWSVMKNL